MIQIDHIHFYVEDAIKWRNWFVHTLGFAVVTNKFLGKNFFPGYPIPSFHTCTEIVKSGTIYFLLSSPLLSTSPVADFLLQHPPGVADIAFHVTDLLAIIEKAKIHNAIILQPWEDRDNLQFCKLAAWGGLTHTLIQRNETIFIDDHSVELTTLPYITAIDHLALNVGSGELLTAMKWYQNIFNFQPQQTFNIQTDRSGLHSQVMVSPDGNVQLPINEPTSDNSQIQEFIEINKGAGIQHIALKTTHIIAAIQHFRTQGLGFLSVPESYYLQLKNRLQFPLSLDELTAISQQQILLDWPKNAPLGKVLLQIFTQPIFSKPTFFLEFIERRSQASGFGEGNFRTLFQAIEQEQIKRGFVVE